MAVGLGFLTEARHCRNPLLPGTAEEPGIWAHLAAAIHRPNLDAGTLRVGGSTLCLAQGLWGKAQLDWIWIPAYHMWTPAGDVYVEGYWDLPVQRCALLCAPASIPPDVLNYPNFHDRPRVVIDAAALLDHLFCQTSGYHYCFGDYYAAERTAEGIYPWFAFHLVHGYDPLYAYYSWLHSRHDSGWQGQLAGNYRYRGSHEEARPAETFLSQQAAARTPIEFPDRGAVRWPLAARLCHWWRFGAAFGARGTWCWRRPASRRGRRADPGQ